MVWYDMVQYGITSHPTHFRSFQRRSSQPITWLVQSLGWTRSKLQLHYKTSNVTSVAEVWSASARLFAGRWRALVSVITQQILLAALSCDYFSSSSVVSCYFSALCVYSKFGNHPHPVGYLCAEFRFSHGLHCWANPWRKILYSITQPAYLMPRNRRACISEQYTLKNIYIINYTYADTTKHNETKSERWCSNF